MLIHGIAVITLMLSKHPYQAFLLGWSPQITIIIFSKKRLTLSHSNPLADGAVVIAGKVHSGGHIDHVRQHGYLALVVALKLLLVLGARWMECFPLTDLAGNLHLLLIHNLRFL